MPRLRLAVAAAARAAADAGGIQALQAALAGESAVQIAGAAVDSVSAPGLPQPRAEAFRVRVVVKSGGGHDGSVALLRSFADRVATGAGPTRVAGCDVSGVRATDPSLKIGLAPPPSAGDNFRIRVRVKSDAVQTMGALQTFAARVADGSAQVPRQPTVRQVASIGVVSPWVAHSCACAARPSGGRLEDQQRAGGGARTAARCQQPGAGEHRCWSTVSSSTKSPNQGWAPAGRRKSWRLEARGAFYGDRNSARR